MKNNEANGYLGGIDPDQPIHRIFPLWFLENALRLKQLVLVSPSLWEDPYELMVERTTIVDTTTSPWRQVPLGPHLRPIFAQAWSLNADSDTLLRAYSRVVKDPTLGRNSCPREEGVRVSSTGRKLLGALRMWSGKSAANTSFLGRVRYDSQEKIGHHLANLLASEGIRPLTFGSTRAALCLLKRSNFKHEEEVRLIFVAERATSEDRILGIPFDPNAAFTEIRFDPRLAPFEKTERESAIRQLGFAGPVSQSNGYQGAVFEVPLDGIPGGVPEIEG